MPNTRGLTRLDTWLSKLLWILAQKGGGEVRVSGTELEDAPEKCGVVTDYDRTSHELRIIAVSGLSETIMINTEAQWARPENPNSTSSPASPPTTPPRQNRGAVLGDEELAGIEKRLMQRAAERQRQKDSADLAEAHRHL